MKIGILGTGALGIAIGNTISNSNDVIMWTKFEEEYLELVNYRENKKFLPGVRLNNNIQITRDISKMKATDILIISLPFIAIRDIVEFKDKWYNNQIICSTTKGIELESLNTTTGIIVECLGTMDVCALSGPSFAREITEGHPIHLMLGTKKQNVSNIIQKVFENTNITLHETTDMAGIEYCGAIKNAIAVGAGMLDGLKAADSTKAAYLASGAKELFCILEKLGVDGKTAYSYAGIGDLILTCTSSQSRNFTFGRIIGEGNNTKRAFEIMGCATVEGYKIIRALNNFIETKNCKANIVPILYDIVFNDNEANSILM